MTRFKLIILFLSIQSFYFSKEIKVAFFHIKILADNLNTYTENYSWTINGKLIFADKDSVKVRINYPLLDTIVLTKKDEKRIILTRFENRHFYELTPFSNLNDIEVYDIENLKLYKSFLSTITQDNISEHDKLYIRFDSLRAIKETGKVIFKLKNYTKKYLIGGTFGEMSRNFTSGKILINNENVEISEPFTSGNSNFCFNINLGVGMILKKTDIYEDTRYINFDYDEERVFVFTENLFSIEYRFFKNETLIVTYNGETNLVSLKLK